MIRDVSAPAQTSAYRSIPARVSSRPSAPATARCRSDAWGAPPGSAPQRNSCRRSSEMAARPPPRVSRRSAALASSATAGSSRARVCSASASVIMRSVCPTGTAGGRCVADLAGDVRVARQPEVLVAVPVYPGMIAQVTGIYDEPELYQLACAYRDVPTEAAALLAWCATHYQGTGTGTVGSVLELAAGPAEHARELARRGLRATALDRSPAMCAYAAAQAQVAGLDLDVVEADMRDFKSGARFDLAITMLNSVCHLFTLDDLVPHLTAVAAHLVVGGLYIVEIAHPADFFAPVPRTSSEWTIEADGVRAQVHWGGRQDRIDPLTQVTAEHMTITATCLLYTSDAADDLL